MEKSDILMLMGGLALFLFGMQIMSNDLEAAAGNKMKNILKKITSNRIMGVLVGAGITTVIQSSSATTVMVVGFVSAGLMTLNQAVWVIMGANIGTTITAQLIALDVSAIAPLFTFVGVVMMLFSKKEKPKHIGGIIAGLGILFIGMNMMSQSMEPLQDSAMFTEVITKFNNPLIGILAGMIFTAIIQSSSASVGILQALAVSGVIGLPQAVYILFGQNIGTCITAVLASIGTKVNARRSTLIHIMFNVIGTVMFTCICLLTPFTDFISGLTPGNPAAQIANAHTVFNITTTLVLLPFGNLMAKAATKILPGDEKDEETEFTLKYITPFDEGQNYHMGQISIALTQLDNEINRMYNMVMKNIKAAFDQALGVQSESGTTTRNREDYIDYLNAEISRYISKVIVLEMSQKDSIQVSSYFKITGNLERIADHAMNIIEYAESIEKEGSGLSQGALNDLKKMEEVTLEAMENIKEGFARDTSILLEKAAQYEQKTDDISDELRDNYMKRMQKEECKWESGILLSEMITDFERIGDHTLNIAEAYNGK